MGRLTERSTGSGASYHADEYVYDKLGRLTSAAVKTGDTPTTVSLVTRAYDKAGQQTRESQTIGSGGTARNIDYTYTAAGRISLLTYPDGSTAFNYTYADNGMVNQIKSGATTVVDYACHGAVQKRPLMGGSIPASLPKKIT
jgi:hypothetical protein